MARGELAARESVKEKFMCMRELDYRASNGLSEMFFVRRGITIVLNQSKKVINALEVFTSRQMIDFRLEATEAEISISWSQQ
jgi:hypothetical protein